MDPVARAKYLRFALEELSAHNGQFEFEAICQEVVKARIASNLVTATGPVAAKGDQGRDAETYVSYMRDELGAHSAFLALLNDKMAAVCCTLQRDDLKEKFKEDARKVVASGAEVERIYALCSTTIAVGFRHEIEAAASEAAEGVPVQLLDGVWIAEQLAASDLFWVAERYLALDETMAPPPKADDAADLDERYLAARDHWRQNETPRPLRGDFYELRAGLRAAKEPGPARPDLPLWLERTERLLELDLDEDLAMQVRYELAVCTLIGRRDLRPADHHVVDFLDEVVESDHPFRLLDAQTLLWFVGSMARFGRTAIAPEQIAAWTEALAQRLRTLLGENPPPTRRAFYRFALGMLLLSPKAETIEAPERELELPEIDVIRKSFDESRPAVDADELVDATSAVEMWRVLIDELPDNSLFPLERLADQVSLMTDLLIDVPGWRELTKDLDEKLAAVGGRTVVGERAMARATRLGDAGRTLDAIAELHTAKSALFAGDSVRASVRAMLFLSTAYFELGLLAASKQYALAAAYASLSSGERDELADLGHAGLAHAARADLFAGNWVSALRLAMAALDAVAERMPLRELEAGPDEDVVMAIATMRTVIAGARDLGECFEAALTPLFDGEAAAFREEVLARVPTLTPAELKEKVGEAGIDGVPFADANPTPSRHFAALGLEWTISPADEGARLAAERLAAAAEVLSAELAPDDLCLLRGEVKIEVRVAERTPGGFDPADVVAEGSATNEWVVTLGVGKEWLDDPEMVTRELFVALMAIFSERSLLPRAELGQLVEKRLAGGAIGQLFAARSLDQLVVELLSEIPEAVGDCEPPWAPAMPPTHSDLAWREGPGPTYHAEAARRDLELRYERLPPPSRLTRRRLLADPSAKAAIEALRADGWLDWQILQAINGVIFGFRLPEEARRWDRRRLEEHMLRPEEETMAEVPLELFSEETLRESAKTGVMATLQVVGLENRSRGPDVEGIRELLAERYEYFSADVEHPDPFVE